MTSLVDKLNKLAFPPNCCGTAAEAIKNSDEYRTLYGILRYLDREYEEFQDAGYDDYSDLREPMQ